jgi:hypothetical protein
MYVYVIITRRRGCAKCGPVFLGDKMLLITTQFFNVYVLMRCIKVKLPLYFPKHHVLKVLGGVKVSLHRFLTSTLYGEEWSGSRPSLPPGRKPPVPDRRLGRSQSRWRRENIPSLSLPAIEPRTSNL